jgi:hypothetical protein
MYRATAACLSSLPIKIDRQEQDTLYLWPLITSRQGSSQIWLTNSQHKKTSSPSTSLIFLFPMVWNGCQWFLVVAILVVEQQCCVGLFNFLNLIRKSKTQQQGGQGGVTDEKDTCCACCAGGCALVILSTQLAAGTKEERDSTRNLFFFKWRVMFVETLRLSSACNIA